MKKIQYVYYFSYILLVNRDKEIMDFLLILYYSLLLF